MTIVKNKRTLVFILAITVLAPLFIANFNFYSFSRNKDDAIDNDVLNIQSFSKDDYNPILSSQAQGLGNVTIDGITFDNLKPELGFYLFNEKYPELADDYQYNALNMSFMEMSYVETTMPSTNDNMNEDISSNEVITVKINETLNIRYNTTKPDAEGYLIYSPRLYPCHLLEMHVKKEGSSVPIKVNEANYSIDNYEFLYFDYEYYFSGIDNLNFSMYLIWEYNISVIRALIQDPDQKISIIGEEQNITAKFFYLMDFLAAKWDETIKIFTTGLNINDNLDGVDELNANITIHPHDKDLMENHKLNIDDIAVVDVDDYLNANNTISLKDLNGDRSFIWLNFTLSYTFKFIDPIQNTWSIDRLISQRDIRERIYFPSIIAGPTHIFLENLKIFERTINIDQYIEHTSLFGRKSSITLENASIYDWESDPQLTTDNINEQYGLNITLPYIIKGEICPFSIIYNATEYLKVTILDNIGMPLIGVNVEVYYCDKYFGTYISSENNQPMAAITTDDNAEILLENIPLGYYELKIYQYGILQVITTVSTYKEFHLVTNIIHFPLWILLFGIFNLSIFAIGYWRYNKNKKR